MSECPLGWYIIEFVGGPLDGPRPVHPTMNSILHVPENPEGSYIYHADGCYHWTTKKDLSG